jgi:hypothetical protein
MNNAGRRKADLPVVTMAVALAGPVAWTVWNVFLGVLPWSGEPRLLLRGGDIWRIYLE